MSSFLSPAATAVLPDSIPALSTMLCNSVASGHTKRAYIKALDDLIVLIARGGQPISRALVMACRAEMTDAGLSPSTINVRLSGIRKLVREARDNGLLDPASAVRITSVPGVPQHGVRVGNWLTSEQARRLLAMPDRTPVIGKRNYAILSVLVHCALRREELAGLGMRGVQRREDRWVIVDLVGKGGRVRTVPLPLPAKRALDEWTIAADIRSGPVFRRILKSGRVLDQPLRPWAVWDVVVQSAKAAGIDHLGPHDLRRTCAQLCRKAGGELEQVQFLLGHTELTTTARYLGSTQDIGEAVNDRIAL